MRNMKYYVWIFILFIAILFISGCDKPIKNEPTKVPIDRPVITAEPTPKKIEEYQAIEIAKNYAYNHTDSLARAVKNVSSVKHFEITSAKKEKKQSGTYYIELKGNFFGMDEYGMVEGRYTFEWTVHVDEEDGYTDHYFPNISKKY